MLDRVVVDVVHMPGVVVFVANEMFPKAPLPDSTFAFLLAALGNMLVRLDCLRETRLTSRQRVEKS